MSDAASDRKDVGRNLIEEQLRNGIILLQIWQGALRVAFAGELGRLDEVKREMWLLLVAAGSGYLARCWHKTLKPKPRLTDFPHEDQPAREEGENQSTPQVLEDKSQNASRKKSPATLGHELASKSSKRNFSPKALSKKLFSDVGKSGKTPKKAEEASGSSDETNRLITTEAQKALDSTGGQSKRSPWSSFRGKSKEGVSDDNPKESSGCLKRAGDSFRKNRERRTSSGTGSFSSRSLQALLGDDGEVSSSVGSSRRELDAVYPVHSLTGVPGKTASEVVVSAVDEANGPQGPKKLAEGAFISSRPKVVEIEDKPTISSPVGSSIKRDAQDSANGVHHKRSLNARDLLSVAADSMPNANLSIKAETVNAVLSLRAANQAQAQTLLVDREKGPLEIVEQNSVEEGEVLTGKGKRRADAGKVASDVEGTVVPQVLTGKRTKDLKDSNNVISREASEVTLKSITGKRTKDLTKSKDAQDADVSITSCQAGIVDLSQVFFGFDSEFFGSPNERSPSKSSKRSRSMSRSNRCSFRKMRESPKPVSALESCLRAQLPFKEEGPRVARSLDFSSNQGGRYRESTDPGSDSVFLKSDLLFPNSSRNRRELGGSEQQSPQTEGVVGLPLLEIPSPNSSSQRARYLKRDHHIVNATSNFPRNIILEERGRILSSQPKLNDVLWRTTTLPVALKKRKVSQACSPSVAFTDSKVKGYEVEALVVPPMEGLLFSFGVGIGVMSLINGEDSEIERLSKELYESEKKIETLNNLLKQGRDFLSDGGGTVSKQVVAEGGSVIEAVAREVGGNDEPRSNLLALDSAVDEPARERFDLYRREAPETPQQIEHMAELEAELEAELDALTGGISEDIRHPPDFKELDPEGVAGVADRDLGVEGLPALLDWDDDNDDFITEEPASSAGGVSPRELARLLRKVQTSWQEHRISELEADLQETVEKLQMMEKELQLMKEQMHVAPPSAGFEVKGSDSVAEVVDKGSQSIDIGSFDKTDQNPSVSLDRVIESDPVQEAENSIEKSSKFTMTNWLGSIPSAILSEESVESETQADNDAVCDEFLDSVFGAPESAQIKGNTLLSRSVVAAVQVPVCSDKVESAAEVNRTLSPSVDSRDGAPQLTQTGEDLDEVVGELLKRDSSSVKNAINAFLLWEAETDDISSKDDMVEEDTTQSVPRRTAGKNPTPQKTSIISARLEQLARSAFTSEKMPSLEKSSVPTKRQGGNLDDKSIKLVERGLETARLPLSKVDDKTVKLLGPRELPSSKDQAAQMWRREALKGEVSKADSSRDPFWTESPVFGTVDKDFQALLDTRRELRYSSAKVQLSLSGPPQDRDRDSLPLYRHREDASRAGTNSPIVRLSTKTLFQNQKPRNSRMSAENRLYQNPTSDWLAEVGSPPE